MVTRKEHAWADGVRTAAEIVLSLVALAAMGPPMLIVALLIKLDSPGPVLYRDRRVGLHGRPFDILKLRTMRMERLGEEERPYHVRITRFGRVLRRYKIDELPGFVNVLRRDMGIVGPRPEREVYTSEYTAAERVILTVPPGLTDYSSIRFIDLDDRLVGDAPARTYREHVVRTKNRLRRLYVRRRSLREDARIVFLTVAAIARLGGPSATSGRMMEHVRLGSTDLQISRIGFGCAGIGGYDYGEVDDEESVKAIRVAIGAGITFFDVADVYGLGRAECILGRALMGAPDDIVVATKVGIRSNPQRETRRDLRPEWVVAALDESLRRLRRDRIDLYQMHWPDPATLLADTLGALERCREHGKIRAIGCCNFTLSLMQEAQCICRCESVQLPVSLVQRDFDDLARESRRRWGTSTICYNTLGQGVLTGKYDAASRFTGTDIRARSHLFRGEALEANIGILERLREKAASLGRTPGQVAVRWVLDDLPGSCAITGIKTARQARENAAAGDFALSTDERRWLAGGPTGDSTPCSS